MECTVNHLLHILTSLSEAGHGNNIIKCQDNVLHTDEITIMGNGDVLLRGYLFNTNLTDKANELNKDIQSAIHKFYGIKE